MIDLIFSSAGQAASTGFLPASMCVVKEGDNPYGIVPAMCEGGYVAQLTFLTLAIMFFVSFYILVTKLLEQNKIMSQGKAVSDSFWRAPTLAEGAAKLEKNSAWRQIADDGLRAYAEHGKLTDPVEAHDWMHGTLERSQHHINSKLGGGMSFLATVGSTAPFIGLFGTVVGILNALVKIGSSGQASIDMVAGPVGEALIMTALGLLVAVPAVMAFNWLQSRNKVIARALSTFANDVQGALMSNGQVKPAVTAKAAPAKAPAAASAKA